MTPNENSSSLSAQIMERTCKFCNAAFTTTGMTLRHEAECANRTPEQRAKATMARDSYRKLYSAEANAKAKQEVPPLQPESERFHGGRVTRRVRPAPDTPVVDPAEERRQRNLAKQREYNKTRPRKLERKRNGVSQLEREVKKASILLTGQRVQITLSLDWETARKLIIQLIPDISIDGVTLK